MHKGWNTFIPPPTTGRKPALCGRKVQAKYCGVPGLTEQERIVQGRPGWCEDCIRELLLWYTETYQTHPAAPEFQTGYNKVFWEMFEFMRAVVEEG